MPVHHLLLPGRSPVLSGWGEDSFCRQEGLTQRDELFRLIWPSAAQSSTRCSVPASKDKAPLLLAGLLVPECILTLAGCSPSAPQLKHCRTWSPHSSGWRCPPAPKQAGSRGAKSYPWLTWREPKDACGQGSASGSNSKMKQWESISHWVFPKTYSRISRFPLLISALQPLIGNKPWSSE